MRHHSPDDRPVDRWPAQSTSSTLDMSHQHTADVRGMLLPAGRLPGRTAQTFVAVKVRTPETVLARRRVPLGAPPVYRPDVLQSSVPRALLGSAFLRQLKQAVSSRAVS